jgi:hypothetical protein
MLKSTWLAVAVVVLSGILFAGSQAASAQKAKKLTYEQAFADCQAKVKAAMPGETTQSAPRYTMGTGCMKDHGYRLKKGAKL